MTTEPQQQSYGGRVGKRRPLLEIVADVRNAIDHADGEITDAIDALGLELEDKAEAYAAIIRQFKAEAQTNRVMESFYRDKAEFIDARAEKLKQRLHAALEAVGVENLKCATATVYFQTSKSVELDDEDTFIELYAHTGPFVRIKYSADKTAIREALESGQDVERAKLVTTKHLRVR